jgi:hypothetical protein
VSVVFVVGVAVVQVVDVVFVDHRFVPAAGTMGVVVLFGWPMLGDGHGGPPRKSMLGRRRRGHVGTGVPTAWSRVVGDQLRS